MTSEKKRMPVRVLICNDSAVVRSMLNRTLRDVPEVGSAGKTADGLKAVESVACGGTDVVVLDVESPVLDGLAALPHIVAADQAVRVLMSSSPTIKGVTAALGALRLGASDFVPKPTADGGSGDVKAIKAELAAKVSGLGRLAHARRGGAIQTRPARIGAARAPGQLAVGSSTGGPAALLALFQVIGGAEIYRSVGR